MSSLDPNIVAAIIGAVFAIERFMRRRATIDAEKIEALETTTKASAEAVGVLTGRIRKLEAEMLAVRASGGSRR